jgi:hypothetical protein
MTRSFLYTFPAANIWYNVWGAVILSDPVEKNTPSGFPDLTFAYVPFVPKMVCTLKMQSQNTTTNSLNSGSVISFAFDSKLESGMDLLSGSTDKITSENNTIDLSTISVKSTVAGSSVILTLVAN